MTALLERPVAKRANPPPVDGNGDQDEEDGDVQAALIARDISEWLADIATYATRKAKKAGKIKGKRRIKIAVVVDPFLRRAVWELRQRCLNPDRAPGPPPACKLEPLPVELP